MLDKMLEVGAGFDWITPVASIIGNIVNGPSHTFLVPYDSSPLSGREIELKLRRRGVKTWGLMVASGALMISVRLSQARWAQHLLEQAGVPLRNPVQTKGRRHAIRGRRSASRSPTRDRKVAATLMDSVNEVLNTRLF